MELHHIHEPEAALFLVGAMMMLAAETTRHRILKVLLLALGCVLIVFVPMATVVRRLRTGRATQSTAPSGSAGS
jgi:hypothetical protein